MAYEYSRTYEGSDDLADRIHATNQDNTIPVAYFSDPCPSPARPARMDATRQRLDLEQVSALMASPSDLRRAFPPLHWTTVAAIAAKGEDAARRASQSVGSAEKDTKKVDDSTAPVGVAAGNHEGTRTAPPACTGLEKKSEQKVSHRVGKFAHRVAFDDGADVLFCEQVRGAKTRRLLLAWS